MPIKGDIILPKGATLIEEDVGGEIKLPKGAVLIEEETVKKKEQPSIFGALKPKSSSMSANFRQQESVSVPQSTSKKKVDNQPRYDEIANADFNTLMEDYSLKSKQKSIERLTNPFADSNIYKDYAQSREGKVGKTLTDIYHSGEFNIDDINYMAKVAPKATIQAVTSILKDVPPEKALLPETLTRFANEGTKLSDELVTKSKVDNNSIIGNEAIEAVKSFGIDPSKINDVKYSEEVRSGMDAQKSKDLAELEKQYPLRRVSRVESKRDDQAGYLKSKQDIEAKYDDINNQLGLTAAFEYAKKYPDAVPKDIGEQWLKQADPDKYKLWVKAGKKGAIDRDIAEIGVRALYGSGNQSAVNLAKDDESNLDFQFPDKIIAETYHRLGAELNKDQNVLFNRSPNVNQLDEAAKQLPQKNREIYYQFIRENEKRNIGTQVPMSGLLNKVGEGFSSTAIESWKGIGDLLQVRSEKKQATDALNEGIDTQFQNVGDYAPAVQRLKQIKNKAKKETLTPQEVEEKQDLEKYTGVRSALQEVLDGTGNLTGQVIFQAIGTKGLGGITSAGLKGAGLLKATNIAKGLAVEEAIAADAMNFGLSKAAVNNLSASAIAFASSYDAAKRDAWRLMPDEKDAGKRGLYATIVGGLNAGTERIFKDEKVLNAFNKEISPSVKSLVNKLSSDEISEVALSKGLADILKKSKSFTGSMLTENTKEGLEEVATSVGQSMATAILAPSKFNAKEAFDDAVSTFTTTFLHGGLVAGMAGVQNYRANNIGVPVLSQIGINTKLTDDTKSFINGQVFRGEMTQQEANEKFSILNTAEKINRDVMPQVDAVTKLPEKARAKYSVQLLNEKILANQAEKTEDPVLKSALEAKVKESETIRKDLLDKKLFVDDNYAVKNLDEITAEENDEITEQEKVAIEALQKKDLSATGLKSYAEVLNDVNATPQQKKEALKGISDQLLAKGTEAETGTILGKEADFIYDLGYETPQESEDVKEAVKFPSRNDDFVSNRDYFTQEQENEYYDLIEQGKENEAKQLVLAKKQDLLRQAAIKNKEAVKEIVNGNTVVPILKRINDADYINESELDLAADELYTALDAVEKDNSLTDSQKENSRNLIEPIISKIEGYEFRTKTETRKITETKTTQIARPIVRKEIKPVLEQATGTVISIKTKSGTEVEGVLKIENGRYVVYNESGNKEAVLGEKVLTDLGMKLPSVEKVENPISFDSRGNVSSVIFETRNGELVTVKNPEKALDIAIQLRADAVGEISMQEFDTVYETIEKEITEEVLANQNKDAGKSESLLSKEQATQEEVKAEQPTLSETEAKPTQKEQGQQSGTQKQAEKSEPIKKPTRKELFQELNTLFGDKAEKNKKEALKFAVAEQKNADRVKAAAKPIVELDLTDIPDSLILKNENRVQLKADKVRIEKKFQDLKQLINCIYG